MSNMPEFSFANQTRYGSDEGGGGGGGGDGGGDGANPGFTISVENLISSLHSNDTREQAIYHLSRCRTVNLAAILWKSFRTMSILIEEIVSTYRILPHSDRVARAAARIVNVLALLQCVAANEATKMSFMNANIPFYLYPLMNFTNKETHYEHIRLTSLGVIGALVKNDEPEAIQFLLKSEIFPSCLRCMEYGAKYSKSIASLIIHKILMHADGIKYCCTSADRFYALSRVLSKMVEELAPDYEPSSLLLKPIVGCYLLLSANPRARGVLAQYLPFKLRDNTFDRLLEKDQNQIVKESLQQIFINLGIPRPLKTRVIGRPLFERSRRG